MAAGPAPATLPATLAGVNNAEAEGERQEATEEDAADEMEAAGDGGTKDHAAPPPPSLNELRSLQGDFKKKEANLKDETWLMQEISHHPSSHQTNSPPTQPLLPCEYP
jgi:hypothetical protein